MDIPPRKVTTRIDLVSGNPFLRSQPRSRPGSPTKHLPTSYPVSPSFHPKVRGGSNITIRKPSSTSSLSASHTAVSAPVHSRPSSPLRPSRILTNGSESSGSPKARVMARPTSRPGTSPVQINSGNLEPRQRALTTVSAKLKIPHPEDRSRSGSVIAPHHALSSPNINTSLPVLSQPSPSAKPLLIDIGETSTSPVVAPVKIKSKVTGLVKSTSVNAGDAASRSLSPPYVTTRPIQTRARAPSITSGLSLNDPPPLAFYPITTASPAANPHRYVPRRALSPARSYPLSALPSEPYATKKLSLARKVDPTSVPLPPHSPPISAISLSSKSSVSKTSTSLNGDQMTENQLPSAVAHIKHRSMERISLPKPFFSQAEIMTQTRRDRSRSKERNPRDHAHQNESDVESDGSERQLEVEARTNRKIADLEITNRSLLAINASLETTRNRQMKEIRDLRRKLRESRLILPPQTYKAVGPASEGEDDEDEDEDGDIEADETFQRVRDLINSLVESGKRALETRPEDFRASLTTKVLNADELRSWRDSGQPTSIRNRSVDKQDADDETIHNHPSPAPFTIPNNGGMSSVESDEELASDSRSSPLPPITITHSS